jgi:hypothetical protein
MPAELTSSLLSNTLKVYVRLARFGDFEVFETMTRAVHFSRKSEFAGVRLPG